MILVNITLAFTELGYERLKEAACGQDVERFLQLELEQTLNRVLGGTGREDDWCDWLKPKEEQ